MKKAIIYLLKLRIKELEEKMSTVWWDRQKEKVRIEILMVHLMIFELKS